MEPLDAFKSLAETLRQSQAKLLQAAGGEPFAGCRDHLQALTGALDELQAAITPPPMPVPPPGSEPDAASAPFRECPGMQLLETMQGLDWPPDLRTPPSVVQAALDLAEVKAGDRLHDLGCGDGRVLIAAAQRGAHAQGVDIDHERVAEALASVKQAGVADRVEVRPGDARLADLRQASVVYLFLNSSYNHQLRQTLRAGLPPGARIVSHEFDLGDWQPARTVSVADARGHAHTLHLWIIDKAAAP